MIKKIVIGIVSFATIVVFSSELIFANGQSIEESPDTVIIGKLDDSERIATAKNKLYLLEKRPNERSVATISFARLEDKSFVQNLIKKHNLKVVKQVYFALPISHGPITRGGFMSDKNGNIFFEEHKDKLVSSLRVSIDKLEHFVAEEPQFEVETQKDREFMKAYEMAKDALKRYKERLTKVQERGITYNGIQIETNNTELMELADNPKIRAIEVVTQAVNKKTLPMLPEGVESFVKQ